jgi:hypothetical protein
VVFGAQKVPLERPRVQAREGQDVELARAAEESTPRGCRWLVLGANWPTTRRTNLPDEAVELETHAEVVFIRGYLAYDRLVRTCRITRDRR